MKKVVTPSNYKNLVQERLVADIFKTPDQRQQDESSGEIQFNTETRKPFEGAEDETVQLTSFYSQKSVRTSTPAGKTVIPRPQIPQSLLLHQTEHSTSQKTPGTPLKTPHSFYKPSITKVVPFWRWLKGNQTFTTTCNDYDGGKLSNLQPNNFTGYFREYLCTF